MSIFQIYCDETGTDKADGTLRIVGLMGWHRFWPKFDVQWCAALNEAPPIRFWHTASGHAGRLLTNEGAPRTLNREEGRAKGARLSEVIGRNAGDMVGLEIELSMSDHRRHVAGQIKPPLKFQRTLGPTIEFLEHPIFIAMREMVVLSASLARAFNAKYFPDDPFHVWTVFETNESVASLQFELGVSVEVLRRTLLPQSREIIGPVIFLPGKGPLAQTSLQAADMYAWHINRMGVTGAPEPEWEQLSKVTPNKVRITEERLKEMVSDLNAGERLEL